VLRFRNENRTQEARLLFTPDWKFVLVEDKGEILSCEPIADGLREVFDQFSSPPADAAR
jgi:hypothetical protein